MKLIQIITFIFLIISAYEDDSSLFGNSDMDKCFSTPTTSCKSVSLSNKNMECCKIDINYYGNSYLEGQKASMCFLNSKQKLTDSDIKAAQQVYREAMGFTQTMIGYSFSISFSFTTEYDCPSQKFTIDYNVGTFTDEEKKVLVMKTIVLDYIIKDC